MRVVYSVDQIEIKRTGFKELQEFRKLLKTEGLCHKKQPFTAKKTVVNGYKAFFAFLSLTFLLMSIYMGYELNHGISSLPFGKWQTSYFFFLTLSIICFISSGLAAYLMKVEIEIMHYLFRVTKARLKRAYNNKEADLELYKTHQFEREHMALKLKHAYEDCLEKIDHFKEETQFLLRKINSMPFLQVSRKEKLYNQTLLEFGLKIDSCVHAFDRPQYLMD